MHSFRPYDQVFRDFSQQSKLAKITPSDHVSHLLSGQVDCIIGTDFAPLLHSMAHYLTCRREYTYGVNLFEHPPCKSLTRTIGPPQRLTGCGINRWTFHLLSPRQLGREGAQHAAGIRSDFATVAPTARGLCSDDILLACADVEDTFEMATVGVYDPHRGTVGLSLDGKQSTQIAFATVGHGRTCGQ
jgi:hypothetical protein